MSEEQKKVAKPVLMCILDGWGVYQAYTGNAIAQAQTPFFNSLVAEYPSMTLRASGEAVGLPWGEPGNSEVGHLSLGLGRIVYQNLPRINRTIGDGSFYSNPALLGACEHVRKNNSRLHFFGLCSNGAVHASIDHLYALLAMARDQKIIDVFVHVVLDGRDTSYNAGLNFVKGIERSMAEYGVGRIASLAGRFYTMDRNNNWDRIAKAYSAMVFGEGNQAEDALAAIDASYRKKIYDEEFMPTVILENGQPIGSIAKGDAVVFFNYRPDRARQITHAFIDEEFSRFDRRGKVEDLYFAAFTDYEKDMKAAIVYPPEEIKYSLGELLSTAGLKQLRISETEKYAHVTYFFNGGREQKSPGEEHVLVPSPHVNSYDEQPEMSSAELTKKVVDAVKDDKYDFILVNFPNADMVGHTGNLKAAVTAVEALDKCLEKIVTNVLAKDGLVLITADHGNAEIMFNMQTGQIDKEHTSNPVPFILVGRDYVGKNIGWSSVAGNDLSLVQPMGMLADVAPTIMHIFGVPQPPEMSGMSLLS